MPPVLDFLAMLAPFEAPRFKIARAKRHIADLGTAIGEYLSSEPFALMVEKWKEDPGLGTYAWVARIREPIPGA